MVDALSTMENENLACARIVLNPKYSKWVGLVLSFLIVVVSSGCERDIRIKIDGKNLPTFELSGSGNLVFLVLTEVHDNKPSLMGAPELWKIRPSGDNKVSKLPGITYGIIPNGFVQVIPALGPPRTLIEGKVIRFWRPQR